ncbi:MAG: hypothetical protein FH756_18350 [Firmicutes bacterium]|nr:hypothetical protein [Bacillota bacterium]
MCNNFLRFINRLLSIFLDWLTPCRQKPTGIVGEAEEALREWKQARIALDYADREMIDYAVHNLNAKEKRFTGLLLKAREAGLTAWMINTAEQDKQAE